MANIKLPAGLLSQASQDTDGLHDKKAESTHAEYLRQGGYLASGNIGLSPDTTPRWRYESPERPASSQAGSSQDGLHSPGFTVPHRQLFYDECDDYYDDQQYGRQEPDTFVLPSTAHKLSEAELQDVTAKVRRNEKGVPTSIGAAGHPDECKPCLFVFTQAGCENGVLCRFCHFRHKRGSRPRPCKGKRYRYRNLLARGGRASPDEQAGAEND
jgi:hypothetical protein